MIATDSAEEEKAPDAASDLPVELNPFVLRCALEAIHFSFGQVACPENPCAAYYEEMWGKELDMSATVPKLMFTIFNGNIRLAAWWAR